MHTCELVELAALVAAHGPQFIRQVGASVENGAERYWIASKCRHDRWSHALRRYTMLGEKSIATARDWAAIRPVVEEILGSEVLTRTWAACATAHDSRASDRRLEPFVRSALANHQEARHRSLNILVSGQGFSMEEAVELNRIRRRAERWTDLLLGHLVPHHDVSEFAFNGERCREFASDLERDGRRPTRDTSRQLLLGSLSAAFRQSLTAPSPNADLNERIASSILSCLQTELFDSTGQLKSMWMLRMYQTASDTQGMIEQLMTLEHPVTRRF